VVAVGPEAETAALGLLAGLRRAGVAAEQGWRGNLKKKMERAGKSGARIAVLIGSDEVAAGTVTVRDLGSGEQVVLSQAEAVTAIRARLAGGGLKG
jgi:histidyl-tRNA synthetase